MGKSAKNKVPLPIRTIVPTAKLKPKPKPKTKIKAKPVQDLPAPPATDTVLDRLFAIVDSRRNADPSYSHSARLLSRGIAKVAQKFGEEAVECLIEAVARNPSGVIAESADVLYHLMVLWTDAGVGPDQVWRELERREGISGIAEKAARAQALAIRRETRKIP